MFIRKYLMHTYFYVPGRYVAGVYFDFFEHAEPVEFENQVQLIAGGIVRPADPSFTYKNTQYVYV